MTPLNCLASYVAAHTVGIAVSAAMQALPSNAFQAMDADPAAALACACGPTAALCCCKLPNALLKCHLAAKHLALRSLQMQDW
jgi:hypothetical protein